MGRIGLVLFILGILILGFNTAAYLIRADLTTDPYLNGQWTGILWGIGGALTAAGAVLGFTRLGRRRPRTFVYWPRATRPWSGRW